MHRTPNNGFTLIEMSMVMLILSLLAGGILIGRELIYSAQIRATIKQTDMFNLAYNTFRLKYNCLPGDCGNATELGFTGGFSIKLSQDDTEKNTNPLSYLNPISNAYAFVLNEISLTVDSTLSPCNVRFGAVGGLAAQGFGAIGNSAPSAQAMAGATNCNSSNVPSNSIAAPLNGNNNGFIESDAMVEGPVGYGILAQARMIRDFTTDESRVYLPLSDAGAMVGSGASAQFKRAFWVTTYLKTSTDGIIDRPGMFLTPIASFLPFSAAAMSVNATQSIDIKTDDGAPLSGYMRANSNANLNLSEGPILVLPRDIGAQNSCLKYDADNHIVYNLQLITAEAAMAARCAVVIALNI